MTVRPSSEFKVAHGGEVILQDEGEAKDLATLGQGHIHSASSHGLWLITVRRDNSNGYMIRPCNITDGSGNSKHVPSHSLGFFLGGAIRAIKYF